MGPPRCLSKILPRSLPYSRMDSGDRRSFILALVKGRSGLRSSKPIRENVPSQGSARCPFRSGTHQTVFDRPAHDVSNGLLLRSDLHRLFRRRIPRTRIDPSDRRVVVSNRIERGVSERKGVLQPRREVASRARSGMGKTVNRESGIPRLHGIQAIAARPPERVDRVLLRGNEDNGPNAIIRSGRKIHQISSCDGAIIEIGSPLSVLGNA